MIDRRAFLSSTLLLPAVGLLAAAKTDRLTPRARPLTENDRDFIQKMKDNMWKFSKFDDFFDLHKQTLTERDIEEVWPQQWEKSLARSMAGVYGTDRYSACRLELLRQNCQALGVTVFAGTRILSEGTSSFADEIDKHLISVCYKAAVPSSWQILNRLGRSGYIIAHPEDVPAVLSATGIFPFTSPFAEKGKAFVGFKESETSASLHYIGFRPFKADIVAQGEESQVIQAPGSFRMQVTTNYDCVVKSRYGLTTAYPRYDLDSLSYYDEGEPPEAFWTVVVS